MAGTLREAELTTPAARNRLGPGIYWRAIDAQTHLGYRRRERADGSGMAGHWMVRWYIKRPRYRQEMIAAADDAIKADGIHTLSFDQAVRQAKKLVQARRAEAVAAEAGPPITVRTAIDEYLAIREDRERKNAGASEGKDGAIWLKRDARSRLTRHVLSDEALANLTLAMLTESGLVKWREGRSDMASGTVRRLANDFKAALNRAGTKYRERLPDNFPMIVRNGLAVREHETVSAARPDQVLTDEEVRRVLVAARAVDAAGEWEGDLFRIVCVLAATGARFSQLLRMTVADVQPEHRRLMVPASHKGRGGKAGRSIPVQVGDDVLDELRPAIAGRRKSEPLFLRPYWQRLGKRERIGRDPWHGSAALDRPWDKIIAHAKLSAGTVPYALRHSSIIRAIRAGLPIRLVASAHDTSIAMIERHYAAFISDALDELARRAVVPLVPPDNIDDAKVIRLHA